MVTFWTKEELEQNRPKPKKPTKKVEKDDMPELQYYTVTQEREVKVAARNPVDAIVLADMEFNGTRAIAGVELKTIKSEIYGHVITPIRVRDAHAREDY